MGPDGLEVEVERSEEKIREVRAANVREYFDAKKNGIDFVPRTEILTRKSVSVGDELRRSFDRVESFIKDKDAYSDEVKGNLDHIKRFMDLFMR